MITFHDNIKYDTCKLIIDKFDELSEKKIVSQIKKDDIRIFGFEKVLDKDITNLFFDIDNKASIKFFKKKPVYQTLMVNKIFEPFDKLSTGSGDGWHRDSYLKKQLKTIFYLTFNKSKYIIYKNRLLGLINSYLNNKSWYRPILK